MLHVLIHFILKLVKLNQYFVQQTRRADHLRRCRRLRGAQERHGRFHRDERDDAGMAQGQEQLRQAALRMTPASDAGTKGAQCTGSISATSRLKEFCIHSGRRG